MYRNLALTVLYVTKSSLDCLILDRVGAREVAGEEVCEEARGLDCIMCARA